MRGRVHRSLTKPWACAPPAQSPAQLLLVGGGQLGRFALGAALPGGGGLGAAAGVPLADSGGMSELNENVPLVTYTNYVNRVV